MWGGATFDVAYRFLKESPWRRLQKLRKEIPDIMFQMLFRASNGVGYTNYPDNVIVDFIKESAYQGIDVIRIFDSLNWVENMKLSINSGLETGKIVEGTMCYTGDILNPDKSKYNLDYYVKMAKERWILPFFLPPACKSDTVLLQYYLVYAFPAVQTKYPEGTGIPHPLPSPGHFPASP